MASSSSARGGLLPASCLAAAPSPAAALQGLVQRERGRESTANQFKSVGWCDVREREKKVGVGDHIPIERKASCSLPRRRGPQRQDGCSVPSPARSEGLGGRGLQRGTASAFHRYVSDLLKSASSSLTLRAPEPVLSAGDDWPLIDLSVSRLKHNVGS